MGGEWEAEGGAIFGRRSIFSVLQFCMQMEIEGNWTGLDLGLWDDF